MAWEQNPYTVKVSLVADSSLSTQVNSAGTPVFTPQFRFVALGSTNVTITANVIAGSNSVTGTTATPAAFAGAIAVVAPQLVPASPRPAQQRAFLCKLCNDLQLLYSTVPPRAHPSQFRREISTTDRTHARSELGSLLLV